MIWSVPSSGSGGLDSPKASTSHVHSATGIVENARVVQSLPMPASIVVVAKLHTTVIKSAKN